MERIVDDFESRRRANEIYSRRNGIINDGDKKKYFSIYKFLFQLLVLINLAFCLILYKNKDYIFSSEFLESVNIFFNVNITEKLNDFFNENTDNEIVEEENETTNIPNSNIENNNLESLNDSSQNEISKIDIIKKSYSFQNPLEGTITSFFGDRESTNPNISGFHTGVDISAVKGTKIKSAISGNVIQVSKEGNYGKHLQIKNNEIITLYAHCNEIYVNEGDEIIKGQEIAEVGSTGNSTGPHLHFEIRYNNEYINPSEIINF